MGKVQIQAQPLNGLSIFGSLLTDQGHELPKIGQKTGPDLTFKH